jgi:hypothetical protein
LYEYELKVFENWALKGIFVSKKEGVTPGGENCIKRRMTGVYFLLNIPFTKSNKMRWAGYAEVLKNFHEA